MKVSVTRLVLAALVLLFPITSSAGEKKLIFNPPGSFLGSPGMSKIDYLSGVLDALYYVEENGQPDSRINACLFEDDDTAKTLALLFAPAISAVKEADESGNRNFAVVDVLIEMLADWCPE